MKTEAETYALQAKKCQEPLEEKMKESSLEISEGLWPCQHLDFGLQAIKNMRIHFLMFQVT